MRFTEHTLSKILDHEIEDIIFLDFRQSPKIVSEWSQKSLNIAHTSYSETPDLVPNLRLIALEN